MSYRDFLLAPADGVPPLVPAPAESERFGMHACRMHVGPQCGVTARQVLDRVDEVDPDLVVLRYPGDRVDWYPVLASAPSYRLIYGESLLVQTVRLPGPMVPPDDRGWCEVVGAATPPDGRHEAVEVAVALLSESFAGHQGHFHADPYLDPVPLGDAYRQWIEALLATPDGHLLLWPDADQPVGALVVEWYEAPPHGRIAEIHLIGVHPRHTNRLEASRAVLATHGWLLEAGVQQVATVVLVHNRYPIFGLHHLGYRPAFTAHTVHLVHRRVVERVAGRRVDA